jgi:hypothetical protein
VSALPFKPPRLPDKYDPRAIELALNQLLEAMSAGNTYIVLQPLAAEPARLVANMIVKANGVDWDPGSGAGIYRRNGGNTAWIFIG